MTQKEIKKEKSRIMELAELLDKQESEIKFLKGELEIQKGCSISKEKIRKKLNYYENSFDYDDDGTSYELVMKVLDELLEEE